MRRKDRGLLHQATRGGGEKKKRAYIRVVSSSTGFSLTLCLFTYCQPSNRKCRLSRSRRPASSSSLTNRTIPHVLSLSLSPHLSPSVHETISSESETWFTLLYPLTSSRQQHFSAIRIALLLEICLLPDPTLLQKETFLFFLSLKLDQQVLFPGNKQEVLAATTTTVLVSPSS